MKTGKIIIKKVKKGGHGGHHGGSWKVAYADFVTAMMAFFLLLWLITMSSPEKRARLATYFKQFNLFEKAGSSMMLDKMGGVTGEAGGAFGKMERGLGKGITDVSQITPEDLKKKIREEVEKKLAEAKDQVMVDVSENGVRIQLVDREGKPMFSLGGVEPSPAALKVFQLLCENIKNLDNKIIIEGHTDALGYSTGRYTNWELSTERASTARKELEKYGLSPDRISMVAGYAATQPLIRDNPNDPQNRRVSITLLYPDKSKKTAEELQDAVAK